MKFKAKEIFADFDENEILIIMFSGDSNDQGETVYFMIQNSKEYDDQDEQLNMETYYIEKNDQSMGGYGGIKELRLDKNRIQIEFDNKGIENLIEKKIEIEFECNDNEYDNLRKKLNQVFTNGELKILSTL